MLIILLISNSAATKIFINNKHSKENEVIKVNENSEIEFRIVLDKAESVEFDPTGLGDYYNRSYGNDLQFISTYGSGNFKPTIQIDGETFRYNLKVQEFAKTSTSDIIIKYIESLKYPIIIILLIIIISLTKAGKAILARLKIASIEIYGAKIEFKSFEISLNKEINRTIEELKMKLPSNATARFFPSSLAPEISYYVHLFEFLRKINATVEDITVWNAIGTYFFNSKPIRSERAFKRAIKHDPENPNAYNNLGMLYLIRKKDTLTAKNYFERAIDLARKQDTPCPCGFIGLASVFKRTNENEKSQYYAKQGELEFKKILHNNKLDYWSYWGLSWCYAHQDNCLDKSIEANDNAIKLKDDFYVAHYNQACNYALKDNVDKCIDQLEKILEPCRTQLNYYGFEDEEDFIKIKNDSRFISFCKTLGLEYNL